MKSLLFSAASIFSVTGTALTFNQALSDKVYYMNESKTECMIVIRNLGVIERGWGV